MKHWMILLQVVFATAFMFEAMAEPQDYWYEEQGWWLDAPAATVPKAHSIAIGANDDVFVVSGEYLNEYLWRFTPNMNVVTSRYIEADIVQYRNNDVADALVTDSSNLLYLATTSDVHVYTPDLVPLGALGIDPLVGTIVDIFMSDADELHVLESARVSVFDTSGNLIRQWGGDVNDNVNAPLSASRGIVVDKDGRVQVSKSGQIKVYTSDGRYITSYSGASAINVLGVGADGLIFRGNEIRDVQGVQLALFTQKLKFVPGISPSPRDIAFTPGGTPYFMLNESTSPYRTAIVRMRRSSYIFQPQDANAVPEPAVHSIAQRIGTSLVDIDYSVHDDDDATLHTEALAFLGGTDDLYSAVPVRTYVEGTATNIGPGTAQGERHRITWDVGADLSTNFTSLAVKILARDTSAMLALDLITIPTNGAESLTISRVPLHSTELLWAWFWLVAAQDSKIDFDNGTITGSAAAAPAYQGQTLAQGTTTTTLGREFLWERIGVRDATPAEIAIAKDGATPGGSIIQNTPRKKMITVTGIARPGDVNEFGFDTETYNSSYYFVVLIAP